ncbi:hypothetical protein DFH08DRAFT_818809 [Mycena albidolilacea]|uniref:Uncharacterized protein n=1 Tax=Mycena albidolilacea TaxID=1033008 RepID=A0AAD6ZFN4_9AGAR|nr:hypothetical protein DFH08DRAFT_818809 [Mycena albidolilacea]
MSIYKISGSGSRRVALMVFESHFCPSESGTRFPECDWLPDGFDGNKIGARCADVRLRTPTSHKMKFPRSIASAGTTYGVADAELGTKSAEIRINIKTIGDERGLIVHQCISRTADAFAIP